jgi:hypothetical protein
MGIIDRLGRRNVLQFFHLRSASLGGPPDKNRRTGDDTLEVKDFLSKHDVKLGECVELEALHDRFTSLRTKNALRRIFDR